MNLPVPKNCKYGLIALDGAAEFAERARRRAGHHAAFEESEERAWNEIETFIQKMNPYDLQELVASLLRAMGYHVAWVAPPGRDGGIDILAFSDPLGTRPPRIKVQVKRQESTVPVDGMRAFMAVLGDEDVGLFVNTGGFTKAAQDEARTQDKRKVTLPSLPTWNGSSICGWNTTRSSTRKRVNACHSGLSTFLRPKAEGNDYLFLMDSGVFRVRWNLLTVSCTS